MSTAKRLPGFAYIPPIAEESCKQAFVQASAQLRGLRQFSIKATTAFEHMTQRLAAPDAGFGPSREESNARGLYDKERSLYSEGCFWFAPLGEVVAAHIAWDMGLPHVAYGLTHVPYRKTPVIYSVRPRNDAVLYYDKFKEQDYCTLRTTKSELLPTFLALAVFDTALVVRDRHTWNTLYLPAAGTSKDALAGIDLDHADPFIDRFDPSNSDHIMSMPRRALAQTRPDTACLKMVHAALTAIENYPVCRVERIARRLMPIAPSAWNPSGWADALRERQRHVRKDFSKLLCPTYQAAILAPDS
jgi:hypothetical protein